MITNERQCKVTQNQIKKLKDVLKSSKTGQKNMPPAIYNAMIAGMDSQISDMRKELKEYEALRGAKKFEYSSLTDLPIVFIKARIARGYTQKEFACKVNTSPQQIQRYESTGYSNISFKKALKFAEALGVKFKGEVSVKQDNGSVI